MFDRQPTLKTIMVVEDDREVRECINMMLKCRGYEVVGACDGDEALSRFRSGCNPSAILLDIMMPNRDGFETLREIREFDSTIPVVMLSGLATPLNIVNAIKGGATDFLAKPLNLEDLDRVLSNALKIRAQKELCVRSSSSCEMFFGSSPAMLALKSSLRSLASCNAAVLIEGETGTGKEMVARQLHDLSPRAGKAFFKLNCAAVPTELLESELFGYERGAFTGALQRKPGLFELADGGTLLLDEIGDMDIRLQAKLLQVLQDQEFRRLGGRETIRVQVRILSATHCNLPNAVAQKTFREDLYYRLNVFTLTMPALRERQSDIVGLAEFLIRKHNSPDPQPIALTERLCEALTNFEWPGNIRQLENVVRKLLVLRNPDLVAAELEHLQSSRNHRRESTASSAPQRLNPRPDTQSKGTLEKVEKAKVEAEARVILDALQATRWNRKQAAARLQIDYKAFLYKMRKLDIEDRAYTEMSA